MITVTAKEVKDFTSTHYVVFSNVRWENTKKGRAYLLEDCSIRQDFGDQDDMKSRFMSLHDAADRVQELVEDDLRGRVLIEESQIGLTTRLFDCKDEHVVMAAEYQKQLDAVVATDKHDIADAVKAYILPEIANDAVVHVNAIIPRNTKVVVHHMNEVFVDTLTSHYVSTKRLDDGSYEVYIQYRLAEKGTPVEIEDDGKEVTISFGERSFRDIFLVDPRNEKINKTAIKNLHETIAKLTELTAA